MKDQDKIMHYKQKYNITNFTTYEDLRRSIIIRIVKFRGFGIPRKRQVYTRIWNVFGIPLI